MTIETADSLAIAALRARYQTGEITPASVLADIDRRADKLTDYNIWIHRLSAEERAPYLERLTHQDLDTLPLWGVPFAIKDNIDLAGVPTTAACPDWRRVPAVSATVVTRLLEAGAIPIGKTNLDQFATGLVGTRSPYGAVPSALLPGYIAGGSSSGSAVAVKLGLASFALGTDTAGSGRIPAAFNELVGMKPSPGWWSTAGVLPACRTLDCVSALTLNLEDAARIAAVLDQMDPADPFARPMVQNTFEPRDATVGVVDLNALPTPVTVAPDFRRAYDAWVEGLVHPTRVIDPKPFLAAAQLLYEGPWLAERYAATRELFDHNPGALLPITRHIIGGGKTMSAVEAFEARYRLAELAREVESIFDTIDALALPSAPTTYRLSEVEANPIDTNSHLGTFTNFVNLLDLCALAVPTPRTDEGKPFGVTLMGPRGYDFALLRLAEKLEAVDVTHTAPQRPTIAPLHDDLLAVAVCGAHLDGQPLNGDLRQLGGYLLEATTTSPAYRLYALPDGKRPALVRSSGHGAKIALEVWALPRQHLGDFLATIAPPLGLGSVELIDGRWVNGFIAEARAEHGALDVTAFGGWLAYRASR